MWFYAKYWHPKAVYPVQNVVTTQGGAGRKFIPCSKHLHGAPGGGIERQIALHDSQTSCLLLYFFRLDSGRETIE